ncbi:MAG: zinc-binding dehydrogenase [Candidatus Latescibacterota bacterium]|nr:zinc-binding dehydrogenase [Candidatus Latescibacterota bacterium]
MKVAAMFGDGSAGLVDKPDPRAGGEFVVVKVMSTPMCTEYKAFAHGAEGDCFGHEAAGEVVEAPQGGMVSVGDRVVVMPQHSCGRCSLCLEGEYIHCQHALDPHGETGSEAGTATYAQYVLKQDWLLVPIPDAIVYDHAAMACCGLGPTFGAMERMQVISHDTVLVTGLGPVGLGGVINASYRGARVIGLEGNSYRAELAEQLGADVVLDPADEDVLDQLRKLTDGAGVDKAVDCSGAPDAQRLMIDALRRKGQACFVGEGADLTITVSQDMIRKGISLHGQWHYNRAGFPRIMQVIASSIDKLETMITHRVGMSQVQQGWELQMTGECGKVVLDPWA